VDLGCGPLMPAPEPTRVPPMVSALRGLGTTSRGGPEKGAFSMERSTWRDAWCRQVRSHASAIRRQSLAAPKATLKNLRHLPSTRLSSAENDQITRIVGS
jgi:hypothetical protein